MKTPQLHRLVMQGDAHGVAQFLFARCANVDAYDTAGNTALMYASQDPHTDTRIVELLLQHGATLGLRSRGDYDSGRTAIGFAVSGGDPRKVAVLVKAGASIHYVDKHGHDALLNAVHHRDIARDGRLLDLLRLLISYEVELNTISSYRESGLRTLSRIGRFDAIRLLLEAGADVEQLQWSALHRAVALESPSRVKQLLDAGHHSEAKDWWRRTPWLLAILAGDIEKAQLLQDYGADVHARGRCGATPLSLAVMGHHSEMLRWLLESGQDVEQIDDFASTPLFEAVESDDVECAQILLSAGASVQHRNHIPQTALASASSRGMTTTLLDAGADVRELSRESRRAVLGFKPDADVAPLDVITDEEFSRARNRRFGIRNPELMNEPFWTEMIRAGVNGYVATKTFDGPSSHDSGPVWCADRFGQSITLLADGRIVQIAGEHEDSYDPDFCIYNDVFVHEPEGRIVIYGYPQDVFAPTDFHTATPVERYIYVIGSLGYAGTRQYGHTPVYRLDIDTFAIEKIECSGTAPGWIYGHVAKLVSPTQIELTSGKIVSLVGDEERHDENDAIIVLDIERRRWASRER
ncbi:MAG TPA: ankyrin repeat domain-containing protein [Steroidobacteraceae bacterium]|nr:ankyrin repeat domain-containing protein [Steroidobacteraceae bacterium]